MTPTCNHYDPTGSFNYFCHVKTLLDNQATQQNEEKEWREELLNFITVYCDSTGGDSVTFLSAVKNLRTRSLQGLRGAEILHSEASERLNGCTSIGSPITPFPPPNTMTTPQSKCCQCTQSWTLCIFLCVLTLSVAGCVAVTSVL